MVEKSLLLTALLKTSQFSFATSSDYLNLNVTNGSSNTSLLVTFNAGDSQVTWSKADNEELIGSVQLTQSASRITDDGKMIYLISGLQCGVEYDIQVQWNDSYYLYRGADIKTDRCEYTEAPKTKSK